MFPLFPLCPFPETCRTSCQTTSPLQMAIQSQNSMVKQELITAMWWRIRAIARRTLLLVAVAVAAASGCSWFPLVDYPSQPSEMGDEPAKVIDLTASGIES